MEASVIDQIAEDHDNAGLRNDRIVVKSDQETSANDIAREIGKCRAAEYGTALDNSHAGGFPTPTAPLRESFRTWKTSSYTKVSS